MGWLVDAVFRPAQQIAERLAAAKTVGNVDWWTDLPDRPEALALLKDGFKRAHAAKTADGGETINWGSDFRAPLARLKDGLKRADRELENLPPDVAAEVRTLQSIVNGAMYAVRPVDEVAYYARSEIGQAGIRGQQAIARHAVPPEPLVPFPFPEAGLPPSLLAEYRAGIGPAVAEIEPADETSPFGFPVPPQLGEREQLVLRVLLEGKAFDSDHRMTTAEIAVKAAGKTTDANQYKEVVAELKRLGYVDTKEGRGGGCWLTEAGRQRAEKL
jgi:hypothetical protein